MRSFDPSTLKTFLEETYRRFHREEYIDPDPLSRVRMYPNLQDREVAAFLCASLALGRVGGILKACDAVLAPLGNPLRENLLQASAEDLSFWFRDFRYRFFGSTEIVSFLSALQGLLRQWGTLEDCFATGYQGMSADPHRGIEKIFQVMESHKRGSWGILLSDPSKGGGMKRWHLFLRWMVRKDGIDLGGWEVMKPSALKVPVDTHLYRFSLGWGITRRRSIDRTTVEEITEAFRRVDPEDPVRFDFSVSRLGIHPKLREVD
jgi:uncharacterized protein (TIGR02757 family)